MANPHRGQVSFEADGKPYKLSFSTNALAELEEMLDMNVNEIGTLMGDPTRVRMKTLMAVFWAALQDNQPGLSMEDVKNILRHQIPSETSELINKTFSITWPSAPEEGAARPPEPKALVGNGQSSLQPGKP